MASDFTYFRSHVRSESSISLLVVVSVFILVIYLFGFLIFLFTLHTHTMNLHSIRPQSVVKFPFLRCDFFPFTDYLSYIKSFFMYARSFLCTPSQILSFPLNGVQKSSFYMRKATCSSTLSARLFLIRICYCFIFMLLFFLCVRSCVLSSHTHTIPMFTIMFDNIFFRCI